ncbi:MAG: hypothetical protein ACFCVK_16125 [Acidimicrobiales bacterium]
MGRWLRDRPQRPCPTRREADDAGGLVDLLIASQQPGLDDTEIAALDQRLLTTMDALGISEACTRQLAGG